MSKHTKAQVLRVARLFAVTFVLGLLAAGGAVSKTAIVAAGVAAAETVLRQFVKVEPVASDPEPNNLP